MKNVLPITEKVVGNVRYLKLDTENLLFRNFRWDDLGAWGKRKCETFVFLSNHTEDRKQVKVVYA